MGDPNPALETIFHLALLERHNLETSSLQFHIIQFEYIAQYPHVHYYGKHLIVPNKSDAQDAY